MKWISVKEQPIPMHTAVLLYTIWRNDYKSASCPQIFVGWRGNYADDDVDSAYGDGWVPFSIEDITHWMPLPEPPKE